MAFVFPDDKADFKAPNGVTYSWDGVKWRTKTYSGAEADARLPYRLGTDKAARSARSGEPAVELVDAEDNYSNVKFFGVNGIQIESTISGIQFDGSELLGGEVDLNGYATIDYSDTEDAKLQNQIDDLAVSRGKVARYKVENTNGTPVVRPGELSVNIPFWPNTTGVSFGIEDLDGTVTKPIAVGDIIDFVDSATEKLSRYRVTDAVGAPSAVGIEYISGDGDWAKDQEKQVYIYPQNQEGVSKDYVDAQDALLGTMITENGKEINKKLGKTDANVVNNNFRIKSDTKTYISTSGGELALNNVKEPTSSHHAATKDYVDSKSGVGIAPPAPLRWVWRNYDSTIDPGEGKFAWNSSSGFFRINYITADGINLGKNRPSTVDISLNTNLTGSIWYKDGDGWKLKQMFDVYRMQWDRNDCMWLYRSSIIVGADGFTPDVQYHITIGGLF